jgi:thiamine kinase-like enzyme
MPVSIEKVCRSNKAFINERFVYESAFPDKPKLIEIIKPQTLVLSKVDGIPYLDVPDFTDEIVMKLAKTIGKLHSILHLEDKVLCHWDNQPRNILWDEKNQKIFLLDFEDIRPARPEADIAHLFLFWAEMMQSEDFTQKTHLFLKSYKSTVPLNQDHWKSEVRKAKGRFDRRRRLYNKQDKIDCSYRLENRRFLLINPL